MKMSKIAAVVAAAALLVIGMAMTSFATGWAQEDGEWVYLDKNGDRVEACWKPSGSDMYYLDDDGIMATSSLIDYNDNTYYVDEAGRMIKSAWVEVENEDDVDGFGDTIWYYFQASGKALKAASGIAKKSVGGASYMFDTEGHMCYGWIGGDEMIDNDEDTAFIAGEYYCGEANDGRVRKNEWAQLYIVDDTDDKYAWFYFDNNGKKVKADDEAATKVKGINGSKYAFDANGVMQDGWTLTTVTAVSAQITSYGYFQDPEVGAKIVNGWFQAVPKDAVEKPVGKDNYDTDTVKWFYSDGKGNLAKACLKTIKGKVYGFDDEGEMVCGLQIVDKSDKSAVKFLALDNSDDIDKFTGLTSVWGESGKTGIMFFSDDEQNDGSQKTGSISTTVDGDEYTFKLCGKGTNKGFGICGLDGNYYYVNGKKITADGEMKVEPFKAEFDEKTGKVTKLTEKVANTAVPAEGGDFALLTSSGLIVKSGKKTDADGYKFTVKSYKITKVEG